MAVPLVSRALQRVPSRVARLAAAAAPDGSPPPVVGLIGPGGSGSDEVLAAVAERLQPQVKTVRRLVGRRLEADQPFAALHDVLSDANLPPDPSTADERQWRQGLLAELGESAALLVDEAQWLDPGSLRVLVAVVERCMDSGLSVVVAHRPSPGDNLLATLDGALSRHRQLIWLAPLDEADVAERASLLLGGSVEASLVEGLHEQTAGLQGLVDLMALSTSEPSGPLETETAADGPTPNESLALTASVIEAVRSEADQLHPSARTVLTALSAGADLDDDLLGSVTGLAGEELGYAIELLRAAGLVVPDQDDVVPVVAAAVSEITPVADRRHFHALLADALLQRGAPPSAAAEHLAAANAQGLEASKVYIAAGDASLEDTPELAREWFERSVQAGTPANQVAPRQAEAAALDGDAALALRLADAALGDPSTADRQRALAVMAALLPPRGYWGRATSAYRELSKVDSLWAEPARVLVRVSSIASGTGVEPAEPAAASGEGDIGAASPTASLELEALELTARGLASSVNGDALGAINPFLEAAELLESGHARLVLPDSPHAVGATVALALSELSVADHLLTRALEHDVGGRALRLRHRLLLGWVAMRSGRWSAAQTALDETAQSQLAPRERLMASAIDAGLARRAGDLSRLGDAWKRAEGVLLRHPADLLSLDPIGELAIAASRLGHWEHVSNKARELGDVMRSLDEPPLWLLPLRWTGLQVALATDDHEAAIRRAAEVEAVAPVHPRLVALADAAGVWVAILGGTVAPDDVAAAARGLQELGLTWEASRMTGQAAIRATDPSITRSLLEQARDLKAALPSADEDDAVNPASVLSEREQMVSQYIVDGLTYKEIGAQLYISPKTVEHHVAKIRQKLGASTRAEMLAALRSQLS